MIHGKVLRSMVFGKITFKSISDYCKKRFKLLDRSINSQSLSEMPLLVY